MLLNTTFSVAGVYTQLMLMELTKIQSKVFWMMVEHQVIDGIIIIKSDIDWRFNFWYV